MGAPLLVERDGCRWPQLAVCWPSAQVGVSADLRAVAPGKMIFGGLGSFLPRALFVAVRLQALPALVLVHLEAAFLLEISHM